MNDSNAASHTYNIHLFISAFFVLIISDLDSESL